MSTRRDEDKSATAVTCESLEVTADLAGAWAIGSLPAHDLPGLLAWVRLRMQAYDEGAESGRDGAAGELWDRESMAEWIAMDLFIDDPDAVRLCDLAGWIEPSKPAAAFTVRIPASKVSPADIEGLAGSMARAVTAALYMRAGLYMPPEAKARGVIFGWCDASGVQVPSAGATHFGWSVAEGDGS